MPGANGQLTRGVARVRNFSQLPITGQDWRVSLITLWVRNPQSDVGKLAIEGGSFLLQDLTSQGKLCLLHAHLSTAQAYVLNV